MSKPSQKKHAARNASAKSRHARIVNLRNQSARRNNQASWPGITPEMIAHALTTPLAPYEPRG